MTITPNDIKERFIRYNEMYFEGVLRMCNFKVYNTRQQLGAYEPRTYRSCPIIKIARKPTVMNKKEWTEEMLKQTIVHEMVHHYVRDILKHTSILCRHGWKFRKVCRRVEKRYGYKVEVGYFIKGYAMIKEKENLTIKDRIKLIYLATLNYILSWIL